MITILKVVFFEKHYCTNTVNHILKLCMLKYIDIIRKLIRILVIQYRDKNSFM